MVILGLGGQEFLEMINGSTKQRNCLKCQEEFPSEWAGSRLCDRCKSGKSFHMNGRLTVMGKDETGRMVPNTKFGPK